MGPPPPPPPMNGFGNFSIIFFKQLNHETVKNFKKIPGPPPPPPPMLKMGGPPAPPPPPKSLNGSSLSASTLTLNGSNPNLTKAIEEADQDKRKLVKIHWREANVVMASFNSKEESIWSNLSPIEIDKEKLSHLFELKQTEVKTKVL